VADSALDVQMQWSAKSTEEMLALGKAAAVGTSGGTVIGLVGDLGAGKTHWTKGFVAGLNSAEDVTSPTFGLLHEYTAGTISVFHYDFYRLESAQELIALGWDEILEADGIVIAEWADKFPELLPPATRWFHFTIAADGSRRLIESRL
jgi:tRNA threonylcarbamoyladenosine biosynthesis protein TsaE